jgi:transposase
MRTARNRSRIGRQVLQYGNAIIAVRLVFDRCAWLVEVAETRFRPDEWYDAAMLLDLLTGHSEDALPLARQIEIVTANWRAIVRIFGPDRVHDTRMRGAFLRLVRAKRAGTPPARGHAVIAKATKAEEWLTLRAIGAGLELPSKVRDEVINHIRGPARPRRSKGDRLLCAQADRFLKTIRSTLDP